MTHAERFLQFVAERRQAEIRYSSPVFRIEDGELVITRRWLGVGGGETGFDPVASPSVPYAKNGPTVRYRKN